MLKPDQRRLKVIFYACTSGTVMLSREPHPLQDYLIPAARLGYLSAEM